MVLLLVAACTPPNAAPTASFTHSLAGDYAPTEVTLDASASSDSDGSIVSYSWKVNGVTLLEVTAVVNDYPLPDAGTYVIALTVTDDKGTSRSSTKNITLELEPPIATGPSPDELGLAAPLDESDSDSFNLGNDGGLPLDVTLSSSDPSWLSVSPESTSIGANEAETFTVTGTCGSTVELLVGDITITTNDADREEIVVPVELDCTDTVSSDFQIQLVLTGDGMTPEREDVLEGAAARWSEVIIGDLPEVDVSQGTVNGCRAGFTFEGEIDDLLILAAIEFIDGAGGILGQAGACFDRGAGGNFIPLLGFMRFDSADMATMEENGIFEGVILHEMGHILDIAFVGWNIRGLLVFNAGNCLSATIVENIGVNAVAEWHALGGSDDVPVENEYGSGTQCSHWDEETFENELMTGFATGDLALSRLTVGTLEDIGYEVNYSAADDYELPSALRASEREHVVYQEVLFPRVGSLNPDGSITYYPPSEPLVIDLKVETHGH